MKRNTKSKAITRKPARAKSPATDNRGTNAREERVEKLSPGEAQKRRLQSLPPAGQGRTVISPTPLDEIQE